MSENPRERPSSSDEPNLGQKEAEQEKDQLDNENEDEDTDELEPMERTKEHSPKK
jgi:hypothetical protein